MTELVEPAPPAIPMPAGWEGILDPSETILWQGQPDGAVHFSARSLPEIGFGVIFAGFAVFWMSSAAAMGAPILFTAFGLPFVLVGLGVILRSNVLAAFRRRRSFYTLTSRRAIIATQMPWSGRSLKSYPITPANALELDEDGSLGTLTFHRENWRDSDGDRRSTSAGFERIPDGRHVLALMRKIQNEAQ